MTARKLLKALEVLGNVPEEAVAMANGTALSAHCRHNDDRYPFIHSADYDTSARGCLFARIVPEGIITNNFMAHYEVEVKSLLGEEEHANAVRTRMQELDPDCVCTATSSQLNHYFAGGDIDELYRKTEHLFSGEQHEKFKRIVEKGKNFSVRTRQNNDTVLLVVKASVDEGTSENTVSRLEFEEPVDITLDALDELVLRAGYSYQAKWSRDREEYSYKGANVCFDRNAGYGYIAEFEKITDDESALPQVRAEIDELMTELGVEELPQDRLARMFEFYNANWPEYYGTKKTFIIE